MLEEIDFQDTNNKVSITIDNETQELPIKKINRLSTYIDLDESLNTALENNIELRASLYYIKKNSVVNDESTEEIDPDTKLNIDGTVTVTIYNGSKIYYSANKKFKKGSIVDSIENTLPLGSYLMVIEYGGNKYFEPSSLSVNFNVEKRLGICVFDKDRYYGEFTETIVISGVFKDKLRDTAVKDCILQYDFDGETKECKTGADGSFNMSITIPKPDITHCTAFYEDIIFDEPVFEPGNLYEEQYDEEFKDEDGNIRRYSDIEAINTLYNNDSESPTNIAQQDADGNIIKITDGSENIIERIEENIEQQRNTVDYYPNASYIIDVYTINDSYYLKDTQIEIIAKKAPTAITLTSVNTDKVSNILTIHGSVLATYADTDNDVAYGRVNISLPDFNYQHTSVYIDEKNTFSTEINLAEVYDIYNASDITSIEPYDTTSTMYTSIIVTSDDIYDAEKNNTVKKGEMFTINAKVISTISDDPIKDGALIFSLYDNKNKLVYQYATELDTTGLGVFNFNTSREMNYKVQAKYIGMFGYQNSQSEKFEVRVK